MCKVERPRANVKTTDLMGLHLWQILHELTLPLPRLALSFALYASVLWPIGFVASFVFFLCALRLNPEAIRGNLGLSRRGDQWVKHVLSAIMPGSNHADTYCHLKHHAHSLGPADCEGACAKMSAIQVLAYGPRFLVDLHRAAWRHGGPRWRVRIAMDWMLIALFVAMMAWVGTGWALLHLAAMAVGQCFTAFFAVWITYQGTLDSGLAGRSQRGPLARAAYLMFYHREHHLFPNVPVRRLPILAQRLESTVPGYAESRQPVVLLWDSV